jgi:subtilase family serine protease
VVSDLIVTGVAASSPVTPGGSITFSVTVQNVGVAPAGPFSIGLHLSADGGLSSSDAPMGSCSLSGLSPGSTVTCAGTLPFTLPVAPGQYHVIAVADSRDDVGEVLETNNAAVSAPITVN